MYGLTVATAISYAMNTEFARTLAAQMRQFNEGQEQDAISRVNGEIDELKDIMVKNIENITNRGERLELLVNQTENLRNNVRMRAARFAQLLLFLLTNPFFVSLSLSLLYPRPHFAVCDIPANVAQSGPHHVLA